MSVVSFSDEVFPELGTRHIILSFSDEGGLAVIPNLVKWTLTNEAGVVINSRENISVTPVAPGTVTITLTGDDLQILTAENARQRASRVLTIYYEYNSTYGTDLPERAIYKFQIENLVGVS